MKNSIWLQKKYFKRYIVPTVTRSSNNAQNDAVSQLKKKNWVDLVATHLFKKKSKIELASYKTFKNTHASSFFQTRTN